MADEAQLCSPVLSTFHVWLCATQLGVGVEKHSNSAGGMLFHSAAGSGMQSLLHETVHSLFCLPQASSSEQTHISDKTVFQALLQAWLGSTGSR